MARTVHPWLTIPAALAALLSGCGEQRAAAPEAVKVSAAQGARPEALDAATAEIRDGQPAQAEARLKDVLAGHPRGAVRAEAFYLQGQAQFAQGKFQAAKESQDQAVDAAEDRALKSLAMLGRADANFGMQKYHLASRQYHWIEEFYRDVRAVPQDELYFKLGQCARLAGFPETADYWYEKVFELYQSGPYAAEARKSHSKLGAAETGEPKFYSLEVSLWGDEQKALAEAEALRAKGYREVSVQPTSIMGTPYYSVQVGRYFNKTDAKRAKEDAELAGLSAAIRPGWIVPPR